MKCGTVRNLTQEEAETLGATQEQWARTQLPPLWLAQPNRTVYASTLPHRASARKGRELAAEQMDCLRCAASTARLLRAHA